MKRAYIWVGTFAGLAGVPLAALGLFSPWVTRWLSRIPSFPVAAAYATVVAIILVAAGVVASLIARRIHPDKTEPAAGGEGDEDVANPAVGAGRGQESIPDATMREHLAEKYKKLRYLLALSLRDMARETRISPKAQAHHEHVVEGTLEDAKQSGGELRQAAGLAHQKWVEYVNDFSDLLPALQATVEVLKSRERSAEITIDMAVARLYRLVDRIEGIRRRMRQCR